MADNIVEYLKRLIKSEDRITFARYMDVALYHPEFGYYCTDKPKIGKDGDYYTGPDVHPFMGHVLGAQLITMWEILGKEEFCIVFNDLFCITYMPISRFLEHLLQLGIS